MLVAADHHGFVAQLPPHLDVLQLELVLQQRQHVIDDRIEIDRTPFRRQPPRRASTD